jgi:phosphatidylglycerophosphatase A
MKDKLYWHKMFATVGGAGLLPLAPGTWGAAVGALFMLPLIGSSNSVYLILIVLALILLTWVGALVAKKLEPQWGEDPKQYVMDEFVGVWVSILGHAFSWQNILMAFLLFRVFDIWKPLGIRRFEKIPNGWGVMLDDVAAGVAANLALFAFNFLFK